MRVKLDAVVAVAVVMEVAALIEVASAAGVMVAVVIRDGSLNLRIHTLEFSEGDHDVSEGIQLLLPLR